MDVVKLKAQMKAYAVKHGLKVPRVVWDSQVYGAGAMQLAWRVSGHYGKATTSKTALWAHFNPPSVQEKALRIELAEVGVTEHPANSNDGPRVHEYQSATGAYKQPWCASFQTWALLRAGLPESRLPDIPAYVPSWTTMIRSGQNGWHAVSFSDARPSDVVTLWNSEHIEMVRARPSGDTLDCVGGNTTSGSVHEANGGAVSATTRYRSEVTIIGRYANPG